MDFFFSKGAQLSLQVLALTPEDLRIIKEYVSEQDYAFAINCALLKYFPRLVFNTPGYASADAFAAEQNLVHQVADKLAKSN